MEVVELFVLIEDAIYLEANTALEHVQRELASRLASKRSEELCSLLGTSHNLTADEQAAALAEPCFMPTAGGQQAAITLSASGPPTLQPQPSLTGELVNDDAKAATACPTPVAAAALLASRLSVRRYGWKC